MQEAILICFANLFRKIVGRGYSWMKLINIWGTDEPQTTLGGKKDSPVTYAYAVRQTCGSWLWYL
jgi:hypothetical protein